MPRYSQEKKDYALSLMSPPNNLTVAEVSKRTGVTEPTLYAWRNQARVAGRAVPGDGNAPEGWRAEDKFAVVVETMGLAEAELGEYCRKKGLHVEQIAQWRAACMQGISGGSDRVNATTLAEERRRHSRDLERELRRKEKGRGRMTAHVERQELVEMIKQAQTDGARLGAACAAAGLCLRTYQRWVDGDVIGADGRPQAKRAAPSNKLSEIEQQAVLATCMQPRFADMPPTQIVPILADEDTYLASESTFYRLLHAHGAQHARGRARRRSHKAAPTHVARAPNEVWCWDVTYLPSQVRGMFFYLYAVLDLYSRKLVAWEVHASESGELVAELLERARWREKLTGKSLVLHGDNGAPQRSFTLRAKLQELGIAPSYSRPGVSDDNAFIESWFRTLKYIPAYPNAGFKDLDQAPEWTRRFVDWYNGEHRHREIGFVTPDQRHSGRSKAVLEKRRQVYAQAQSLNPTRWSRGIRCWGEPDQVYLNQRDKER